MAFSTNCPVAGSTTTRTAYAETPPRVGYKLTPTGKALIPVFIAIADRGMYLAEDYKSKLTEIKTMD